MEEWTIPILVLLGAAAMLVGLVGCIVPFVPGPAIAYAALYLPMLFGCQPPVLHLAIGGGLLVVVLAIDYLLPSVCAKKFKCSGWGVFGCFAGSIVGLFFLPFGIVLGPFIGTVVGELIAGRDIQSSLRGGLGALLGFVLCLGIKLASVGLYACCYFLSLPRP